MWLGPIGTILYVCVTVFTCGLCIFATTDLALAIGLSLSGGFHLAVFLYLCVSKFHIQVALLGAIFLFSIPLVSCGLLVFVPQLQNIESLVIGIFVSLALQYYFSLVIAWGSFHQPILSLLTSCWEYIQDLWEYILRVSDQVSPSQSSPAH